MSTIATDIPTHEELVSRAQALVPVLRERAAEMEETGRIADETIEDLRQAGFFRYNAPKEYGGYAVSGRTRNEILSILAAGDASTAWVIGVYSGGVGNAAHLPERMKAELFANGPDVRIAGSGTPSRDAKKVDGGYRVSGRWFSVSGSAHADWVSLFFAVPGEGDGPDGPGPIAKALVPVSDVTIERTWDAAGMRGTESDTVVAADVFVPDYRVELLAGPPPANPILSIGPCAIPIGIAQGALDRAIEYGERKAVNGTIYQPAATSTSFQNDLAEAALRIDTARLHLLRATTALDEVEAAGEELPLLERARIRGEAGWIVKNITEAIDIIMTAVGSGAFASSSPFERAWRDVSTTSRHGAVSWQVGREVYGKVLLGQDGNISRLPV
ncbi:MAG: acyl-CoA dehydrogenase family protein [Microbacterium sp.]|uniref:acyl-CoA dehydrogenase family protein n=1 Tax=Microbacterium sp. TaxID=51671 RepID=UPI0039E4B7BA